MIVPASNRNWHPNFPSQTNEIGHHMRKASTLADDYPDIAASCSAPDERASKFGIESTALGATAPALLDEADCQWQSLIDGPILWLQPHYDPAPQSDWLKTELRGMGLQIMSVVLPACITRLRPDFSLVMLRVTPQFNTRTARTLAEIRTCSRTPIVLLIDNNDLEWALTMLQSGVDAVIAYDTPLPIMLAHCLALIRRWRPAVTHDVQ
jgi:hypothetical protein